MKNKEILNTIKAINRIKAQGSVIMYKDSLTLNRNLKNLVDAYAPIEETLKDRGLTGRLTQAQAEEVNAILEEETEVELQKLPERIFENIGFTLDEGEAVFNFLALGKEEGSYGS